MPSTSDSSGSLGNSWLSFIFSFLDGFGGTAVVDWPFSDDRVTRGSILVAFFSLGTRLRCVGNVCVYIEMDK